MSQMLEAQAELSSRPSFDVPRRSEEPGKLETLEEGGSSSLAIRLKEIFEFDNPEEVIEGQHACTKSRPISSNMDRVPLLASEECLAPGIHVHHDQTRLFLCIPPEEIGQSFRFLYTAFANSF